MGNKIFVSGLVNVETTLKINNFPITYSPIEYLFNGIESKVSGVGYNVSKAFSTLGDEVHFHSLIGRDALGELVIHELTKNNIGIEGIYHFLDGTPQSIVIYNSDGERKIFCDLKNIQDTSYPDSFAYNTDYKVAVLTNVNFSREFFNLFKSRGIRIATDCHVLKDIHSEYDREFLQNADILFMSNAAIVGSEEAFLKQLVDEYHPEIIVIGMGNRGSILYDGLADDIYKLNAVTVRPVVNTVGAGDALFSSFLHYYIDGYEPYESLYKATYFAGYKIGENGGGEGFLSQSELEALIDKHGGWILI